MKKGFYVFIAIIWGLWGKRSNFFIRKEYKDTTESAREKFPAVNDSHSNHRETSSIASKRSTTVHRTTTHPNLEKKSKETFDMEDNVAGDDDDEKWFPIH